MIDWEVMVSNSNTRWSWANSLGGVEPVIPWHQHVYPDGSPVSYTEAAAIRRCAPSSCGQAIKRSTGACRVSESFHLVCIILTHHMLRHGVGTTGLE